MIQKHNKKARPPIEQLRKAGKIAKEKLIKMGILSKDSFIDYIEKNHPKIKLPGLPAYLPKRHTIQMSQRIMYDLLRIWQKECNDRKKAENLALFIEFCTKEMTDYVDIAKNKLRTREKILPHLKDVPVLGEIFEPIRKYETIKGVRAFYIDSFAIATFIEKIDSTGEYAEWFLVWTNKMSNLWSEWGQQQTNASTKTKKVNRK